MPCWNAAACGPARPCWCWQAAGGVGLATVQLGRALGLRVLAAAGGADKCALCLEHGAEQAFDYRDPAWPEQVKAATGGRGVDAVLDPVGGDYTGQALRLLAFGGRLLIVGFAAGSIPEIPANRLLLKDLSALGVVWGAWRRRNRPAAAVQMAALFDLWRQGAIAPLVSERRPLREAPQAIMDLGARRTTGKVSADSGGHEMSAETPRVPLPPPILYAVAIGLGLWLERPLPWPLPGGTLRFWSGVVLIALAVALFGLCLRELRRHQTTINPHRAASNLVETGPFRFSRNPIYVSLTVLQVGVGLLASSTWVLLMLLWVLPLMQRLVIAREEEHLRWRFGSEYVDYSARVRRWL